jgi:uncharacterized protein YbjT (DUF2867 family)
VPKKIPLSQVNTTEVHPQILLTGATGYVGGRLLRDLEGKGYNVRCLARRPEYLQERVGSNTEVVKGDLLNLESLLPAMEGVHTAYYLVHSMGTKGEFEDEDRQAARNFCEAAERAGVSRIIYLGGLCSEKYLASPHMRSRREVGEILRASDIQVLEFQASIIIGSGSLSFELVRSLVERLPVMIIPRWVSTEAQPIALRDVLVYLAEAMSSNVEGDQIFEIGGHDVISYRGLMEEYARQRGLKRLMVPVPVLSPRLSSLWLGLVTPVYARVGRKLIDSIRLPTVVQNPVDPTIFGFSPMGVSKAIADALQNEDQEFAQTRWSDAQSSSGTPGQLSGVRLGSRVLDSRKIKVNVPPSQAFKPIRRIGGKTGWYFGNWLWRARGLIDLMVGGVGIRRGRRDPESLRIGDTVDWWRVVAYEPGEKVLLEAEMKVPGRAWLEFVVEETEGGSLITQTAVFDPIGLPGMLYWYLLYPLHTLIFAGMIRSIARQSRKF